jgi:guanylate kinase
MGEEGLLFIVSAPSGAGKTSLCKEVVNLIPDLHFSISYTTRPPRQHEVKGIDYYFISLEEFQKMIDSSQLIEWTEIYGNFYGTSKASVEENRRKGRDIIFDIDPVGARSIKEIYSESVTVFILPPSHRDLEERLIQRGTDDEAVIRNRLKKAREEMEQSNWYQYRIVNDDFKSAVEQLKEIIAAERLKRKRNLDSQKHQ